MTEFKTTLFYDQKIEISKGQDVLGIIEMRNDCPLKFVNISCQFQDGIDIVKKQNGRPRQDRKNEKVQGGSK